jgi:hypothetical protein
MRRASLALAALLLWCAAAHADVTRQIADAPGWLASTSYTGAANLTSSRVLAGPGSATQSNWLVALTNARDIIGQTRPNGSSYDDGTWEFYPTTATIGAGGRLRRFP